MALTKCRECENPISTKAKMCPKCGAPIKRGSKFLRFIVYPIFWVFVFTAAVNLLNEDNADRPVSSKPSTRNINNKQPQNNANNYIEVRVQRNGVIIKGQDVCKGPGKNYANDETGDLLIGEKLYVLGEKNGWIRFRVTPKDEGWSAWTKKNLTITMQEINEVHEAKFGKRPFQSSFDGSISCVDRYLKAVAHDPDSIKYESWSEPGYNKEDGWLVKCEFRAKNMYGAYVRHKKWFVIRHGQVVDVKDSNAYTY